MAGQHRSLEITCLGTGMGSSHVYEQQCSASYVMSISNHPVLLIGAGGGAIHSCLHYFGTLPSTVFIHNNRSHQAADLPVFLGVESSKGRRIKVFSEVGVCRRLQSNRLAELHQVMGLQRRTMDDLAEWQTLDNMHASTNVGGSSPTPEGIAAAAKHQLVPLNIDATSDIAIGVVQSKSTESSFGIKVYVNGRSVFAIGGDSGFDEGFYSQLVEGGTEVCIVDGRPQGSGDHASYADIATFAERYNNSRAREGHQGCAFFIGQYGSPHQAPAPTPHVSPISTGMTVELPSVKLAPLPAAATPAVHTTMHEVAYPALNAATQSSTPQRVIPDAHHARPHAPPTSAETTPPPHFLTGKPRTPGPSQPQPYRSVDDRPHAVAMGTATKATHSRGETLISKEVVETQLPPSPKQARPNQLEQERHDKYMDGGASATWKHDLRSKTSSPSPTRKRSSTPNSSRQPARYPTSNPSSHVPRKITIYNNENRAAPSQTMMVQLFRDVRKLSIAAADKFGIRPAGPLFFPDGTMLTSVDQINNGDKLVVTKHAGAAFDPRELPKLLIAHLKMEAVKGEASRRDDAALYEQQQRQQAFVRPGGSATNTTQADSFGQPSALSHHHQHQHHHQSAKEEVQPPINTNAVFHHHQQHQQHQQQHHAPNPNPTNAAAALPQQPIVTASNTNNVRSTLERRPSKVFSMVQSSQDTSQFL